MEAWKKSGLCIWKRSHTPAGLIFLMIPPSSQPRTRVGTLTSIPWEPAVRLFHGAQGATQDSWNGSQPSPDSPQMCLSSPMELWAGVSLSRALCYYQRFTGPQKRARCWSKRKTHISLTWELRDTDMKLGRDGQWLYGESQRRKVRQLCRVLSGSWNSRIHKTKLSNAIQNWVSFKDDIKCSIFANPDINFFLLIQQSSLCLKKCDCENNKNRVFEIYNQNSVRCHPQIFGNICRLVPGRSGTIVFGHYPFYSYSSVSFPSSPLRGHYKSLYLCIPSVCISRKPDSCSRMFQYLMAESISLSQ